MKSTLDVGCGFPNPKEPYTKRGDVGIDLERGYADIIADAHYLPFKPDSFGLARIYYSLDHFHDPEKVLLDVHRVAEALEISTSNSSFWAYAFYHHPKEHFFQWNLDILGNLLRSCGFQVVEWKYFPATNRTWRDRVLERMVKMMFRSKDSKPLFSNILIVKAKRITGTRESFNYQWGNLKESPHLLSNPEFKEKVSQTLLNELQLSKEDVKGKNVLDVGCGNGRWSYAFKNLQANVVAYDYTRNAALETHKLGVDVVLADALHPPFRPGAFDLVFSFGVLHHTGNLPKALAENAQLSRDRMHVYLYGAKALRLRLWRKFIQLFPLKTRPTILKIFLILRKVPFIYRLVPYQNVHGGFDALSPKINDESNPQVIERLFFGAGFQKVMHIKPTWCDGSVDIHMRGEKTWV